MKNQQKQVRQSRVARKIKKNKVLPRLVVFRSNKFIYAQIIDDSASKTLVFASDIKMKPQTNSKLKNAKIVGENLAKLAAKKDVKKIVFDRAGYKYHGRVKAVAEGAREG